MSSDSKEPSGRTGTPCSLAPKILSDEEFSVYSDDFTFVFNNEDIRNIALSGQYGAGKSSVMRTLEKNGIKGSDSHHYLFVSLAFFDESERKTTGSSKGAEDSPSDTPDAHRVEKKILMQLVHQLDRKKAPKSRFARTVDTKPCIAAISTVAIVAFVILSILLFRWYGKPEITALLWPRVLIGALLWTALLLLFVGHMIRRGSFVGLLRRLQIGSFAVDLGEDRGATPLDRYMDDLVYLINASDTDVIVFEDLDRFDSVELFEKLREINELANTTRSAKAGPLRFFYLIRDSLFPEARDRTKFFDFIIPVVPFVDPSNAESILSQRLKSIGVDIDKTFLYQVGIFIDDPRILNDIANEFEHFMADVLPDSENRIGEDDYEHLLAIITFKVMFPKDYEMLQRGRGCLATLLMKRKSLVKSCSKASAERLCQINAELNSYKMLNDLKTDELTLLYGLNSLQEYVGSHPWHHAFQQKSPKEIIAAIRSNTQMSKAFDAVAKTLESNSDYLSRVKDARDSSERQSEILLHEKEMLEQRVANYARMSLRDLLALSNSEDIESFFELTENDFSRREDFERLEIRAMTSSPDYPLVRYLLMSGMIDESYRRYTSHLYPGGINPDDAGFVSSILQGKDTDEARIIYDPDAVLIRLEDWQLKTRPARNMFLFARLVERNDDKTRSFLQGVNGDGDYRFLAEYIGSDQYVHGVFSVIKEHLDITAADLVENATLSAVVRRNVCHRFIADEMEASDKNEEVLHEVGSFASSDPSFLNIQIVEANAISCRLASIGYRPTSIDISSSDDHLLRVVVDDGLFKPDATLVDALIEWDGALGSSLSQGKLATRVWERRTTPFFVSVEADLALFVSTMLEESSGLELADDAGAIAWILGNSAISDELAESFARVEHGERLHKIDDLNDGARKGLAVTYDLAECNALNVLEYAREIKRVDDRLVGFLERNGLPKGLNGETCKEILGSECLLVDYAATTTAKIPDALLSAIAKACAVSYSDFELNDVPDGRISVLIELGCIEMNEGNLAFLRERYSGHVCEFAVQDFDNYLVIISCDGYRLFDSGEALQLLEERALPVSGQLSMLEGFQTSVRVNGKYADEINASIIESHLDKKDLSTIVGMYQGSKPVLKQAVIACLADNLTRQNIGGYSLGSDLMAELLEEIEDKDRALDLLTVQLQKYDAHSADREEIKRCLVSCGKPAIVDAMDGKKNKLTSGEADDGIIKALIDLGMLSPKSQRASDGSWLVHKRGTGHIK